MDLQDSLQKIKTALRLSMNGVAAAYMRESGMHYKVNFGVELPRLREIAAEFPVDHRLAQALWKEDIRECKLLAAMLQPTDTFCPEIADIWVESIPNTEIAQHTVQNLFCRLPYASQKAFEWIAGEKEMPCVCGFLILARLFMQGLHPNERSAHEFLDQAAVALRDTSAVRRAAMAALQKYQMLDETAFRQGEKVLQTSGY